MTTRPFASTFGRRRLVVFTLLLLSTIAVLVLRRPPVKAEAQIFPMPEKPPSYPLNPLDRWIPMKWGWLWKIRYAIFGYNPNIHVSPILADLSKISQGALASVLPTIQPLAQTNGMQVWILPPDEYEALQMRLVSNASQVSTVSLTTGPWVQANMESGYQAKADGIPRWVGLSANIYTRLTGKAVELNTVFTLTEVVTNPPTTFSNLATNPSIDVQTNLTVAARFLVPESNGVVVVDSSRFLTEHKRTAIFLAPRIEPYSGPGPSRKK